MKPLRPGVCTNENYANTPKQYWLKGSVEDIPPMPTWIELTTISTTKLEDKIAIEKERNRYRMHPELKCRVCKKLVARDLIIKVADTNFQYCPDCFQKRH